MSDVIQQVSNLCKFIFIDKMCNNFEITKNEIAKIDKFFAFSSRSGEITISTQT